MNCCPLGSRTSLGQIQALGNKGVPINGIVSGITEKDFRFVMVSIESPFSMAANIGVVVQASITLVFL